MLIVKLSFFMLDFFRRWTCQMQYLFKCLVWCCHSCPLPPQLLVCNLIMNSSSVFASTFVFLNVCLWIFPPSNGCFSEWLRRSQEKHSSVLCPQCRAVVQFVSRNHFLHNIEEVAPSSTLVLFFLRFLICWAYLQLLVSLFEDFQHLFRSIWREKGMLWRQKSVPIIIQKFHVTRGTPLLFPRALIRNC